MSRKRLRELLGLDRLEPATPAYLEVPEPADAEPLVPHEVGLRLADGTVIPSFLLRPAPEAANGMGVVLIAGHGRGIDSLVETAESDEFNTGTAHAFVRAGFTVLCPEVLSFGRRRFPQPEGSPPYEPAKNSCVVDANRYMMHGTPLMGRRVADAAAAVDALAALPGVDPQRVVIAGGSGGGAVSLLLAAVEPTVAAALVAAYFCTFEASLCSIHHCPCNLIPGILPEMEMADVASLIAPRPLVLEAGEGDHLFPIAATRASFERLAPAWEASEAPVPELVVTEGGHAFRAERSLEALVEQLAGETGSTRPGGSGAPSVAPDPSHPTARNAAEPS